MRRLPRETRIEILSPPGGGHEHACNLTLWEIRLKRSRHSVVMVPSGTRVPTWLVGRQ